MKLALLGLRACHLGWARFPRLPAIVFRRFRGLGVNKAQAVGQCVDTRSLFENGCIRGPRARARLRRQIRLFLVLPAVQALVARVVDSQVGFPSA